ncbi:MAG TPA: potassium channel family protein [Thermoleophilaceae bacterium]|jgi:voltage-gated potassium channel
MLVAAALVIPAVVLDAADAEWAGDVALPVNCLIWLAFAVELVVLVWVAPDRRRWLREHPLEVAIVVLTPPVVPGALQGARALRLVRLLRLIRLGRLLRWVVSLEGVRYASTATLMVIVFGGVAFAEVEDGRDAWDGVWWAVTTVTTVGYGDLEPHTDVGRAIAMLVMFAGIGFVALLTGAIAQRFVAHESQERHETIARLDEIATRLERLEGRLDARPERVSDPPT